eukprot:CAMPEP_0172370382 /NCGR_PEP_ID=MMETSP1060-20121228/37386_1 /TAXON_ID=37318 /ORGANISM="Pseudo-nitzschia pungens, Strain cf. cingulata" /LENGTH=1053 /DNA_ID=CAMNT_0013095627 /DNA_START=190 /DNA_END=3351 /DNA_ORIENTATION=+
MRVSRKNPANPWPKAVLAVLLLIGITVGSTPESSLPGTPKESTPQAPVRETIPEPQMGTNVDHETTTNTDSSPLDAHELDCRMRSLAMEVAGGILSDVDAKDQESVLSVVRDALQFSRLCPDSSGTKDSENGGAGGARSVPPDASISGDENANAKPRTGHASTSNGDAGNAQDEKQRTQTQWTLSERKLRGSSRSGTHLLLATKGESGSDNRNHDEDNESNAADVADMCSPKQVISLYVSPPTDSAGTHRAQNCEANGSRRCPWTCLHRALDHARRLTKYNIGEPGDPRVVLWLEHGVHYLGGKPLALSELDNDLEIRGIPGSGAVWISGGIPLRDAVFRPSDTEPGVYVADLTSLLEGHDLPKTPSLFGSTRRYVRARYPDGDPEVEGWGREHSLSSSLVLDWTFPPPGAPPDFVRVDFANDPPEGVPTKNDSTMDGYNLYASGSGGVCTDLWGPYADSYWCSNASEGGWAEVDQDCATRGQLQIPVGMAYNRSEPGLEPLASSGLLRGGNVFAWHSQSWAMHMFEIADHSPQEGTMAFAKGGGRQGGRNWCRCDQCTYAGPWCGQHQTPPDDDDQRLIGGDWMIENVRGFLDQPGEFFFDRETSNLYVKPNATDDLRDLTLAVLTELVGVRDAKNIRLEGLSFRDQAATYLDGDWSAPSGGDWALRRGGAVFVENSSNVTIRGCRFFRLDGTAVFLSRRTRHVSILNNRFEWLGENAVATWGDTDGYDGTSENFPLHTLVEGNVMRELGIYQKQSSGVGISKAALTTVRKNIMFNMARAAINFNDMVGGGDVVEGNLIFNTCRESGDHGPINSWDRQAYLTTLRDGTNPSFDPLPRIIRENLIVANYGASQGVDNDDGSSWFHIHHNVFYDADGFKMDYGGHDSIYEQNMAISLSYRDGPCFGMGSFKQGHGDVLRGNRCLVGVGKDEDSNGRRREETIYNVAKLEALHKHYGVSKPKTWDDETLFVGMLWGSCKDSPVTLESNEYYTPDGIARIGCDGGRFYTLSELQSNFGLEVNSMVASLPDVDIVLEWARSTLGMERIVASIGTSLS